MSVFGDGDPGHPAPTPEQVRAWRRRSGRPVNEVPGTVAVGVLLARTDEIAVAIGGLHAYSSGLQFDLVVRQRHASSPEAGVRPRLHELVTGFRRGAGADALLLGFAYPDTRTVTNIGPAPHDPSRLSADAPVLRPGGGGGDDQAYDGSFWLSPVPTGGDLTVVCAWPARGIGETRSVIARQLIEDALARIVELWPAQDEPATPPPAPPPPVLPPDSWFAQALRDDTTAQHNPPSNV
jgi:hypothetical protein